MYKIVISAVLVAVLCGCSVVKDMEKIRPQVADTPMPTLEVKDK